jgi:peptidoglycan hydrolase-like protein with peptidoglycan-binding domain
MPDPAVAGELALGLNAEQRRQVQIWLESLGFNPRGVDGQFGPGTRGAIRQFQRSKGVEETGFLSAQLFSVLSKDGQQTLSARGSQQSQSEPRSASVSPGGTATGLRSSPNFGEKSNEAELNAAILQLAARFEKIERNVTSHFFNKDTEYLSDYKREYSVSNDSIRETSIGDHRARSRGVFGWGNWRENGMFPSRTEIKWQDIVNSEIRVNDKDPDPNSTRGDRDMSKSGISFYLEAGNKKIGPFRRNDAEELVNMIRTVQGKMRSR